MEVVIPVIILEFNEAFKCQEIVVNSFSRLLSASKDDNWLLPVMQVWNKIDPYNPRWPI